MTTKLSVLHNTGNQPFANAIDADVAEFMHTRSLKDRFAVTKLNQYFGKRVEYRTLSNGREEITVFNSRGDQIANSTVSASDFSRRPTETNAAEVTWACKACGVTI